MATTWKYHEFESKHHGYENWKTYCVRDAVTNVHIATVGAVDRYFELENEKHTRLITAAPELLDALKKLEDAATAAHVIILHNRPDGQIYNDLTGAIDTARAAIAKAEGK